MSGIDAAEAFTLLADETRVRIVHELGRARGTGTSAGRSYAELMDAVGAVDSGRFNYHLQQLVDHFVHREGDDYTLAYEGVLIYRSIVAGTFSEAVADRTFDTATPCHQCSEALVARVEDHFVRIACPACTTTYLAGYLPPRGYANRSTEAILSTLDLRVRAQMGLIGRGVCPWCYGRAAAELVPDDDLPLRNRPVDVAVRHDCVECRAQGYTTVGQRVLDDPALIALHADHGIRLTESPLWALEFAVTDRYTTIKQHDPLVVELAIPVGADTYRATIEQDGSIDIDPGGS